MFGKAEDIFRGQIELFVRGQSAERAKSMFGDGADGRTGSECPNVLQDGGVQTKQIQKLRDPRATNGVALGDLGSGASRLDLGLHLLGKREQQNDWRRLRLGIAASSTLPSDLDVGDDVLASECTWELETKGAKGPFFRFEAAGAAGGAWTRRSRS